MAAPGMELFDQYFKRADLDRDGRISGAEAVAFFQGSNLSKQVLAQIWMHADQNRTGFLGRPEFYNALRLVTVAQSGRELTPDIVKAALFGPAAAKIPAPKIDQLPVPAAQMGSMATGRPQISSPTPPSTQMGAVAPTSQNFGFRGPQVPPNAGVNQQLPPSFNNSFVRPPLPIPAVQGVSRGLSAESSMRGPGFPGVNTPNLSTDWLGTRTNGVSSGGASLAGRTSGVPLRPQTSTTQLTMVPSKPLDSSLSSFQPPTDDSKALVLSGNGSSSDSVIGGDAFSTNQARSAALTSFFPAGGISNAPTGAPVPAESQNLAKSEQPDPFRNISTLPHGGNQLYQSPSVVKKNQPDSMPSTSATSMLHISAGAVSSAASQAQATQLQWPKITQSDVRKYTRVFVEVDRDRDGKITGLEARNLFLSWRLPREILKQVWDLSDEDSDSMLSLREFCIALYLMERYREGGPLPGVLPNTLRFDATLLQATGQPPTAYVGPSWQMTPGVSQQGFPASRPVAPGSGPRPLMHNSVGSLPDGALQPSQNIPRDPMSERNVQNQQSKDELSTQVGTNEVNKVQEKEEILDSREKIAFYRTKMQELVLYKSRCDNRLNEISERASADKREVELLAKKYEEKYKQVADIASKLTVEEATFRHTQERKVELQNAIVKMEQGGSVDGLLQVRADRIQSDLEGLAKALSERCKQHGIDVMTAASVELPFGWQPGIQEGAVDWDEEWDKFEDEGFSIAKELTGGAADVAAPEKSSVSLWGDEVFADEGSTNELSSHIFSTASEHITENGAGDAHSEDGSVRSPRGSPGRAAFDSPRDFHSPSHDVSPRAKDSYSDYGGAESTFSGDKFGDESSWGANFDANDDVDSVWGFNTKDAFGSGDFGLNPIKIDSPGASSEFGKGKNSFFEDSVPSSPLFNSTSPPSSNDRLDNHSFDTSGRFDSFSMRDDGGLFQQRESLSRFDSMRSTSEFDHSRGFSFDDGDPFGSTGPFKSTASHSPRKGSDNWNAF